jgi:CAAX prenyl protease-like protein
MQAAALHRHPAVPYIAPFAVFITLMAVERFAGLPPLIFYPLRLAISASTILLFSFQVLPLRPSYPLASIGIGLAVFAIWIAPDLLFGYRHSWIFENALTGRAATSLPPGVSSVPWFLAIRSFSSFAVIPVLEELFWRGWLMRWLIDSRDFERVPIGKYDPGAFWLIALLFASEHGPYWEVGLIAGVAYNWWLIRTKNLADCILAHGVTNAILSAYVIGNGQFQYWL